MNIKKNLLVPRRILKAWFIFHYSIQEDPMLVIGVVAIRQTPCSCYSYLSTLVFTCNIKQKKYNKY